MDGNVTIPTAAILQKMKTQAGHKATPALVQEDLRTLIKTRWFFSVVPKYRRTDKKLILVLDVIERPIVHNVVYLGATQIKIKKLAAETGLKVGSPYDMGANKEAARHLETFYHEQGYTEATVDLIQGDKPEQRDVVFRIHEGVARKSSGATLWGTCRSRASGWRWNSRVRPRMCLSEASSIRSISPKTSPPSASTMPTWASSMPPSNRPSNIPKTANGSI